nr:MAG TPA: hypothetical protein [Caudoviricetes sp.]
MQVFFAILRCLSRIWSTGYNRNKSLKIVKYGSFNLRFKRLFLIC